MAEERITEIRHVLPEDIEKTSFSIIEQELREKGREIPEDKKHVILRVIHTTADFDFVGNMRFSDGAVAAGLKALKSGSGETVIVTDTNMTLSGISKPGLSKLGITAECYMADEDVAKKAAELKTTRAVASVKKAVIKLAGRQVIYAIGNAPTALFELIDRMDDGFRPALIIAVPVGFVNVVEAKEAVVFACEKYGVPYIAAMGNKGGSTVSAAICNALIYRATGDRYRGD